MANNLTYTLCGDYYIPDIKLHITHIAANTCPVKILATLTSTVQKEYKRILFVFIIVLR